MNKEEEIQRYAQMLCPNCVHNKECDKNKFVINKFNTTKNIKCFDYEWKDLKV